MSDPQRHVEGGPDERDPADVTDATTRSMAPAPGEPADTTAEPPVGWRRSAPPADWVERVRLAAPRLLERLGVAEPEGPALTVDRPLVVPAPPGSTVRDLPPIGGSTPAGHAAAVDWPAVPARAEARDLSLPVSPAMTLARPLEAAGPGGARRAPDLDLPDAPVRSPDRPLSVAADPRGPTTAGASQPMTTRHPAHGALELAGQTGLREAPSSIAATPATRAARRTEPPARWPDLPSDRTPSAAGYPDPVRSTRLMGLRAAGIATPMPGAEPAWHPEGGTDPWPSLPSFDDDALAVDPGVRPQDLERQARLRVEQRRL